MKLTSREKNREMRRWGRINILRETLSRLPIDWTVDADRSRVAWAVKIAESDTSGKSIAATPNCSMSGSLQHEWSYSNSSVSLLIGSTGHCMPRTSIYHAIPFSTKVKE